MANKKEYSFNVFLQQEDDMFVASCVEFGTVSQGKTIEEALENIKEATELFIEDLSDEEIQDKVNQQIGIMRLNVTQNYSAAS